MLECASRFTVWICSAGTTPGRELPMTDWHDGAKWSTHRKETLFEFHSQTALAGIIWQERKLVNDEALASVSRCKHLHHSTNAKTNTQNASQFQGAHHTENELFRRRSGRRTHRGERAQKSHRGRQPEVHPQRSVHVQRDCIAREELTRACAVVTWSRTGCFTF